MAKRVFVVDDERGVREALRQLLEYEEIDVRTAYVTGSTFLVDGGITAAYVTPE